MADERPTPGRLRPAPTLARRAFLTGGLATVGAGAGAAGGAPAAEHDPPNVPAWSKQPGVPVNGRGGYGTPSGFEAYVQRRPSPGLTRNDLASVNFTPLQSLFGIITPSGVHFERHHSGSPDISPEDHRLMLNGLVRTPKIYTMGDVLRLPSVSRVLFLECGANTGMEWANVAVPTVQYTHGMLGCCEYTGVRLATLLEDAGYDRRRARFVLAEGADGAGLTRTVSIEMALDDGLVAYAMNGEMLRPENGYPLRLVVPGVQGVSWVKWLRRIEVGDRPWDHRDEVLHYVDLMPGGLHRQYTWIQECKSVITSPSGGQALLDRGYYEITGLAWSGRGKVTRVDVSTDGGRAWRPAALQAPIHAKALTRFRADWRWDGSPALLQSRAVDDTGYVQPRMRQLRAVRGTRSIYHNNAIQTWRVDPGGEVTNVQV